MQPDELKNLRTGAGLTQQQLADAIGMTRVSVGLMERGQMPIERRTALAMRYLSEHPEAIAE